MRYFSIVAAPASAFLSFLLIRELTVMQSALMWWLIAITVGVSVCRKGLGPCPVITYALLLPFLLSGVLLTSIHRMGPTTMVSATVDDVYSTVGRRGTQSWHLQMHADAYPELTLNWGSETPPWKKGQKVDACLQTRFFTDVYGISVGPCPLSGGQTSK